MHVTGTASSDTDMGTDMEFEGEPPELTGQYLLNLFKSCNITQGHVNTLGIHLHVPDYDITEARLNHPTDPAMQAVMVCHRWLEIHPEESEDRRVAYEKLKSVLKAIRLSGALRRMNSRDQEVKHKSLKGN